MSRERDELEHEEAGIEDAGEKTRIAREIKLNRRLNSAELALKRYYRREGCRPGVTQNIADAVRIFDPKLTKLRETERKESSVTPPDKPQV